MNSTRVPFAVIIVGLTLIARDVQAQEPSLEPMRSITNIRGDLYRVQDDRHFTVFLVTPEGIFLADPLNVATARWLRTELEKRFPNQPVRYVLHSHHASDRASGGGVFDATAELVGHEAFGDELSKARSKAPTSYEGVVGIESRYDSRRTLTLGVKSVQLVHPGRAYAVDMTVLLFPAERVLFAADYPPLSRRPVSISQPTSAEVLTSVRVIEALDFDTFLSGDGEVGTKAEVTAFRQYLEDLMAGVKAGFKAGLTVDQLHVSLTLDKHRGTPSYAQRNTNITEAYGTLRTFTTSVYGAAQLNYSQSGIYMPHTTSPAVTAGASFSMGPLSAVAEVTTGRQFTDRRTDRLSGFAVDHRETIVSFVPRYDFVRNTSITVGAGAGLSAVMTRSRVSMVEGVPVPGFPTTFTAENMQLGFTVAADVVATLGRRIRVVLPVRLTHAERGDFDLRGLWNVQVGAGLIVPVFRRVY